MLEWNKYAYPSSEITIRIVDILESYSFPNSLGMSVDDIISRGSDGFFNFEFPWYSDTNEGLQEFKNLFLHKYYMKQIGQETEALFKLNIQSLLMERMPEWTEIFRTTKMVYDPLINRSLKRMEEIKRDKDKMENSSFKGRTGSVSNSNDTTTGDTQSIDSDNPQVTIGTKDYASKMNRGQNKVVGSVDTSEDVNTQSDSTNKSIDSETGNVIIDENGYIGECQSDNIMKYRRAIVNLNLDICNYLKRCFLLVY